ncbi:MULTISPECIES: DUF1223 domain-containing protein [unclassified Methylophaga]|uniref:DUF1223 domain-containing protein n=1 Tax=unclassified Methylophaga TaxID=2629249 RepID=UPI000C8C3554|nr:MULTISPECIES: DUF1223 domain-containing protein [unclassified Methylophaga]MBN44970.1 hypothetical protein [Methylophaga sp.]|tara:strand:- start:89790 stop:90566 length:777 start_codon:yes stop_codon:yes gene_type:complete
MNLSMHRLFWLALVFLPLSAQAVDRWQASSNAKHTAVLELFTSEGCGLCPPAERWLYQQQTELNYIVLGFHIDYLNDKKGWVDVFAKPEFSERQKQLALLNRYQTIYTPEFVLSGESLPNWRENFNEAVSFLNEFDAQAQIRLRAYLIDDALMIDSRSQVTGEENRQHSKLYIAITEDDVLSDVQGGDNAGRTFNHQNLVREWLGPFDLDPSGETFIEHQLKLIPDWQQDKLKLVALIQNLSDGYILQAVELPLTQQK